MSAAGRIQDLLQRNKAYASTYQKLPPLAALRKKAKATGGRSTIIISCSDPRVVPADFLKIGTGEFAIIRNAGGRATEAVHTLAVLDALVSVGAVMVIHHTDCGQTHVHDHDVRNAITARRPELAEEVKNMKFGEITDMDGSVIEDMKLLKTSPLLPADLAVFGFVLDLETGLLREVEA